MAGLDHLPDARDGLTHVERRLLHHLVGPAEQYTKSRPALDAARRSTELTRGECYGVLVRLAQEWVTRYPLVDGEGNFGSVDDDPPAASKYTEVRRSPIGEHVFNDGDPRVDLAARSSRVDFARPLGGAFPTLLANGATGGIASIPPHHLGELAAAVALRIERPTATLDDVLALLPGPDYPTGGELVDVEQVRAAYASGRGEIELRSTCHLEDVERQNPGLADLQVQTEPRPLEERISPFHEGNASEFFDADGAFVEPEPADALDEGEDEGGEDENAWEVDDHQRELVITALPYGVTKGGDGGVIHEIATLLSAGYGASPRRGQNRSGIADIQDYSDRRGMRLRIGVRDGHDPVALRDELFELTQLQAAVPVLMVALVDGKPEQLTLLDVIDHYIGHQRAVRTGGRADIDAAIVRDLAALASLHGGERRTRLPGRQ